MRKLKIWLLIVGVSFAGGSALTAIFLLRKDNQEEEIRRLREVIQLYQTERRVAEVSVLEQDETNTTFRWREIAPDGMPVYERDFTIEGDVAYFDARVVKFDHDYVERGDLLRGKSIYLFERIFGEHQEPARGFRIDQGIPSAYRISDGTSEFEQRIWDDFWGYALNPDLAAAEGIRVAQGEAVRTVLKPGRLYRITIEAAGGLNIHVSGPPGARN